MVHLNDNTSSSVLFKPSQYLLEMFISYHQPLSAVTQKRNRKLQLHHGGYAAPPQLSCKI